MTTASSDPARGIRRAIRSTALAVLVAAITLPVAACSGTPEPPPRPSPTTARPDVASTIELVATEDSLTWQYTLRNDGTTRIAVLNARDPAAPDEAPPVWVGNAGGGTVEVSQRLHDMPEGLLYDEPIYAQGSILDPGESVTGRASVDLPLKLNNPHVREQNLDTFPGYALPDRPTEVVFCLGVLEVPAEWDDARLFTHDGMASGQHLVCAEPHSLDGGAR